MGKQLLLKDSYIKAN